MDVLIMSSLIFIRSDGTYQFALHAEWLVSMEGQNVAYIEVAVAYREPIDPHTKCHHFI